MKNRKEIMEEIGGLLERAEYGALVFVAAFLQEAAAAGTNPTTACGGPTPFQGEASCGGRGTESTDHAGFAIRDNNG